jgi:predicted permease
MMQRLLRRIRYWMSGRRSDAELAEEIELHRTMTQARLERDGMQKDEAAHASRRALGNITLAREDARNVWTWSTIERAWQDVRYGARTLRQNPSFTLVAVLTLTLGIGANTAMFSVLNTVLLRPLPYGDPDRLAMIWTADPARNLHESPTSFPTFMDWRHQSRHFADMAFWRSFTGNLTDGGEAERVIGAQASANLLPLLGVAPSVGRTFTAEEEQRRVPVIVLSHSLWQRRFGADPAAIGRSIEIDGRRLQVIGVMPPDFYFPNKNIEHWVPASLLALWAFKPETAERSWSDRFADHWSVIGRLAPRSTVEEAQAEMTVIGRQLAGAYPISDPDVVGFGVEIVPMLVQVTGPNLQQALWALIGAVSFVLVIACANVANLLLARASARRREFAIRSAIGAGRARLLRQLFVEHSLLALAGGALGCGAAIAAVRVSAASSGIAIPRFDELSVDGRVLGFAAAVSAAAALLFGLLPAWRGSAADPGDALKQGGSTFAGSSTIRARAVLVVTECALAVALLAGAGLLVRSFLELRAVNPGFDGRNVLLVRVNLPIPVSRDWRTREWHTFAQIEERIASIPGVMRVGATTNLLVTRNPEEAITVEGWSGSSPNAARDVLVSTEDITPGFFQAMGVPLLRGRFFTHAEQNRPVAIVNETFGRRFFPGEDPVGRRFREGGPGVRREWVTIVGVVGDMH